VKKIKIHVPVLVIGFNRPDVIRRTFDLVCQAQPLKLYVAIDGPRVDKEGEANLVEEVKAIVQKVDWECETYYKFHAENKGAEVTVSSAIAWVLEKEEYVIVLEDDIIAPMAFLRFAQEMLIRYKDEPRIAIVSGCNFTPIPTPNDEDYFFAKYGHSWGWATWRRVWKDFNLHTEIKEEHLKLEFLKTITNSTKEAKYYRKLFKRLRNNGISNNTWDFIFLYSNRVKNMCAIVPKVNLTSNIGTFGLHAKGVTEHHFRKYDESFVVEKHPDSIKCFKKYDEYHFKYYIDNPMRKKIINTLKLIFKIKNK